jgi:hypothetical protein
VKHVRRILLVLGVVALYFVVFGLIFGWHRLGTDWWPLDRSVDGPNLYVSFVWLPLALVGGYIVSDIRHDALLEAQRLQLEAHERRITDTLNQHGLAMTTLLGMAGVGLDATPADRSLDTPDPTH